MSGTDYTLTTNLGLYKPVANADVNAWGAHLNSNADMLDTLLKPGGTAPFLPLAGGGTISPAYLRLDGAAGTARPLAWSSALSARWQFNLTSDDSLGLYAYDNNGSYLNTPLSINRTSGPTGASGPYIFQLAPWSQSYARGSYPNSSVGNWQNVGFQDRSPAMPLPANPLATTAGSPVVTIRWPGACNSSTGWISGTLTWINLQGAAAVGGITPAGWFPITAIVDSDHFQVTWTANATATVAAGGGSAVTAQPSHTTTLNRVQSHTTSGAGGFPIQTGELWEVVPDFLPAPGAPGAPAYEHRWHWTVGPNDPTGAFAWSIAGIEWDLTNRGHDWGYQPNIYAASNNTVALWIGPVVVPAWATGGGQNINWGAVYAVFSGQNDNEVVGVYQAFTAQPNSLVGQKFDPTGHGGVGVDLFGSYSRIPYSNPFSVTLGSPNVTVRDFPGDLVGMANGDQVYIPGVYTINGVTFGGGTYAIASLNQPAGTFVITGTGNATATGSGGGAINNILSFVPMAPYAPMQTWGLFQHGLVSAPGSRFLSGGIIETQPGNGILWNDGTGTASVNAVAASAGNIGVTITTAGTGVLNVAGHAATAATTPASFSADHRLAIQVNGTTYYLPVSTTAW